MPTGHYQRTPWGKRVHFECRHCAAPFSLLASVVRKRATVIYCSKACDGAAKRKPEARTAVCCAVCGKDYVKWTRFVREKNYCSQACGAAAKRREGAKWRDPAQIRAYMKAYRERNLERMNERARIGCANRRARRRKAGGRFTRQEWDALCERQGHACLRCGAVGKLTVDHVVPISAGGVNTIDNIQGLCGTCNRSKATKHTDYRFTLLLCERVQDSPKRKAKAMKAQHGVEIREV